MDLQDWTAQLVAHSKAFDRGGVAPIASAGYQLDEWRAINEGKICIVDDQILSCGIMRIQPQTVGRSDVGSILRPVTRKDEFLMLDDHTPQLPALKTCTTCNIQKPATTEYYYRDKNRQDGFSPQCKACHRAYHERNKEREAEYKRRAWHNADKESEAERAHAYYMANREKAIDRARVWRKANPERLSGYYHAYRAKNRDRANELARFRRRKRREARPVIDVQSRREESKKRKAERLRAYRLANKERIQESRRAWRNANREKVRALVRHRKALKRNATGTHTAGDVERQRIAQRGKCYYCGVKVGDAYHADHVVPLSRGGSDGPENIVIACAKCNQSKSDRLPHEWPEGGRLL